MSRPAKVESSLSEGLRSGHRCGSGDFDAGANEPPQPLGKSPSPLNATLGPIDVTIGWRVGAHEPASDICTVAADDVVRINGVALGFSHFFNGANLYRFARVDEGRAPLVVCAFDLDFRWCRPGAVRLLVGLVHHH